jgi:hypothetical protein
MLTLLIWWGGVLLEVLLLVRGIRAKWMSRFPIFYSYHVFILLEALVLFGLYRWASPLYSPTYWTCEWIGVILGSLILLEIYRVALRQYPGTARMARNLLGFVLAMAVAKALVGHSYGRVWWPAKTYAELERNLRVVQVFAVLAIVVVMLVYAIPRARHLKGILAGYGLYVAAVVASLTLLTRLGDSFQPVLTYVQPLSYNLALAIWTVALWAPEKEKRTVTTAIASEDHPTLVARTKEDLEHIRLGLRGAAGQ